MQPTSSSSPPQSPFIVFWILWFALLSSIVMIQVLIGHGIPQGNDQGEAPIQFLGIAAGAACVSLAIRFLVLPRIKNLHQKLPAMLVGLAMAEAVNMFSLFLIGDKFPHTQLVLFITSLSCALCYVPIYAAKQAEEASSFGYRK